MTVKAEQETTVSWCAGEDLVRIYTAVPKHVRAMVRDDRFSRESGDGEVWGTFTIPTALYDPLKGVKRRRRTLTPDERVRVSERLTAGRKATTPGPE